MSELPGRAGLWFSAEHATARVAPEAKGVMGGMVRPDHRAFDSGAGELAVYLGKRLGVPVLLGSVTRQVVDLNRSLTNRRSLWGTKLRTAPPDLKQEILKRYYLPYREAALRGIRAVTSRSPFAVHIAVHSFTPVRAGCVRRVDIGLLYDSRRVSENRFCLRLQKAILHRNPQWRVRFNQPYRGSSDSLVKELRSSLGPGYLGIELEINQRLVRQSGRAWLGLKRVLVEALSETVGSERFL
ncbi:MAG: N-formylglutamate amidohydrolase [Candidatus Omnitrophica bacterium]|nr:N-formylglutamate amidohydrolase [Candidatus Omnitrophota bacterium]